MTKKIIRVAAAAIIDQEKGLVLAGKRNADRGDHRWSAAW